MSGVGGLIGHLRCSDACCCEWIRRTSACSVSTYDGAVSRLVGGDDGVALIAELLREERRPILLVGAPGADLSSLLRRALADYPGEIVRLRPPPDALAADLRRPLATAIGRPANGAPAESISELLRASSPGTLVIVDDAARADATVLRELVEFAESDANPGIRMVLLRGRDAGVGSRDAAAVLDELSESTIVRRPVTADEAMVLATGLGIAIDRRVAQRLIDHTEGDERAILDLLMEAPRMLWRAAPRDLPAPRFVTRAVGAALGGLSPSGRAFVETASVLAQPADLADILSLADLADPPVAFGEAGASGLIVTTENDAVPLVLFTSPMVRRAVLDHIGPSRRSRIHQRAASILAQRNERLRHRAAASLMPDSALAAELDSAGTVSARHGNWAEAAELIALAGRLTDDQRLKEERRVRAIDALVAAGDTLSARELLPQVDRLRETALHDAVLGYLAVVQGQPAEAEARLSRAWRAVDPMSDPELASAICQRFVLHSLLSWNPHDLVRWIDRAIALAPADSPIATEARAIRGLGLGACGDVAAGFAAYDQLTGLRGAQAQRVIMGRGWLSLASGRIDEARTGLSSSLPPDLDGGSLRISAWAHAWLARVLFLVGEWEHAMDIATRGIEIVEHSGMTFFVPLLEWTVSQIHAMRNEGADAVASLQRGSSVSTDYLVMRLPSLIARANVAEAGADYRGVVRTLTPLAERALDDPVNEPGFWPWVDLYANALVMEGRLDEAASVLEPHIARARVREDVVSLARLALPLGRLHAARGEIEEARQAFEDALHRLDGLPLEVDRARLWFAYGQSLRRAGKRRESDTALWSARQLFARLGAIRYIQLCDREIAAAGVGTHRGTQPDLGLTSQERIVARLVASGKSNREVASELYISAKTVQFHLTRIYGKLGIRSRAELAARYRETGAIA